MAEPIAGVEAEFTLLKHHFTGIRRRTSKRYRCALATLGKLSILQDNSSQDVWAHNLSESGIGFNLDRTLPEGTAVQIRLKSQAVGQPVTLSAKVAHATQNQDGTFRIGCAFDRNLTLEELDALL